MTARSSRTVRMRFPEDCSHLMRQQDAFFGGSWMCATLLNGWMQTYTISETV